MPLSSKIDIDVEKIQINYTKLPSVELTENV